MINVPFVFGIGFFYRMFVPGLAAGLIVLAYTGKFQILSRLEGMTIFILFAGLLGLAVRIFFPFVSDVFYGAYWPTFLRRKAISTLVRRLRGAERLIAEPSQDASTKKGMRQAQARGLVYLFPFDVAGNRFVVAPTIVGNVCASLISFLQLQYGLHLMGTLGIDRHMAFVFVRLWFLLERGHH